MLKKPKREFIEKTKQVIDNLIINDIVSIQFNQRMLIMALFSKIFLVRSSTLLALLGAPVLLPLGAAGMDADEVSKMEEEFSDGLSFARTLLEEAVEHDPWDLVLMRNPEEPLASRIGAAKRAGAEMGSEAWDFLNDVATNPETPAEACVHAAVKLGDSLLVMQKIQDPSMSEKTLLGAATFLVTRFQEEGCKEKATSILFDLCRKLPEESTLSEKERSEARVGLSSCLQEPGKDYDRFFVILYPLWAAMAENQNIEWSERFNIVKTALSISERVALQGAPQIIMNECFSNLKRMLQNPSAPAEIRSDAAKLIFSSDLERHEAEKNEARDILIEMATDSQSSPHLRLEAACGLKDWALRQRRAASASEDLLVFREMDVEDLVTEIVTTASDELLLTFVQSALDNPAMSIAQGFDLVSGLRSLFNVTNEAAISPYLLEIVQSLELSLAQRWDAAEWLVSIVDRTEHSEDGTPINIGLEDAFAAFLQSKSE